VSHPSQNKKQAKNGIPFQGKSSIAWKDGNPNLGLWELILWVGERIFCFHFPRKIDHFCDFFTNSIFSLQGFEYIPNMRWFIWSPNQGAYAQKIEPANPSEPKVRAGWSHRNRWTSALFWILAHVLEQQSRLYCGRFRKVWFLVFSRIRARNIIIGRTWTLMHSLGSFPLFGHLSGPVFAFERRFWHKTRKNTNWRSRKSPTIKSIFLLQPMCQNPKKCRCPPAPVTSTGCNFWLRRGLGLICFEHMRLDQGSKWGSIYWGCTPNPGD